MRRNGRDAPRADLCQTTSGLPHAPVPVTPFAASRALSIKVKNCPCMRLLIVTLCQ
jgi:hypothetical protein